MAIAAAFAGSRENSSPSASAASSFSISRRQPGHLGLGTLDALAQRLGGRALLAVVLALAGIARRLGRALGAALVAAVVAIGQHAPPVIVEIAVERRHLAVGDEPEPVGAGVEQMAVVRNEDHGAGIVVDRLDQGGAAVDVEMVGRLVEDEQVRAAEGREAEHQAGLLAARQLLDLLVGIEPGKADRAGHARASWFRGRRASVRGRVRTRSRRRPVRRADAGRNRRSSAARRA